MRQMPQEAANFRKVDKAWRAIMTNTVADRHVLIATDYPNMLDILRENNVLLEEIQKGLNDYLEKKRLFFPRLVYFCPYIESHVKNKPNLIPNNSILGSFSSQMMSFWKFSLKQRTLSEFSLISKSVLRASIDWSLTQTVKFLA